VTFAGPARARVTQLTADEVRWLYELRAALELEAAHLALERNGGRLSARCTYRAGGGPAGRVTEGFDRPPGRVEEGGVAPGGKGGSLS
jgi:hypothetical protein